MSGYLPDSELKTAGALGTRPNLGRALVSSGNLSAYPQKQTMPDDLGMSVCADFVAKVESCSATSFSRK